MKEQILKLLRDKGSVSGQEMGDLLRVSRTAVWKHINELRSLGYEIDSSPRLGYTLVRSTDRLLPGEIQHGLAARTMGRHIFYYPEITSTQDVAAELAKGGADEGSVVVAEMQTRGRGRKARTWVSAPDGGVYLSLILRPPVAPDRVTQIPLVAGIALTRAIGEVSPLRPEIMWPNNILIGGRKVAGILTEMTSEIDRITFVILGVGVNVNTPRSSLPEKTAGRATSMAHECGQRVSRVSLVKSFLCQFEKYYTGFLAAGFASLRNEWKSLSGTLGHRVKVQAGGAEIEGLAVDLDDEGFLLVRKENGDEIKIVSGDVLAVDND